MATIKSVTSQAPLSTITNYVTKSEKTEEKLLSGKDCNPELAGKQMMNTKKFYGKLILPFCTELSRGGKNQAGGSPQARYGFCQQVSHF